MEPYDDKDNDVYETPRSSRPCSKSLILGILFGVVLVFLFAVILK